MLKQNAKQTEKYLKELTQKEKIQTLNILLNMIGKERKEHYLWLCSQLPTTLKDIELDARIKICLDMLASDKEY